MKLKQVQLLLLLLTAVVAVISAQGGIAANSHEAGSFEHNESNKNAFGKSTNNSSSNQSSSSENENSNSSDESSKRRELEKEKNLKIGDRLTKNSKHKETEEQHNKHNKSHSKSKNTSQSSSSSSSTNEFGLNENEKNIKITHNKSTSIVVSGCTVQQRHCRQNQFLASVTDEFGCPQTQCQQCTEQESDRKECSNTEFRCPALIDPECKAQQFVLMTLDTETMCPELTCKMCTLETQKLPGCATQKVNKVCAEPLITNCDRGFYIQHYRDTNGCMTARCARCTTETLSNPECKQILCPSLDIPRCPHGFHIVYGKDQNNCSTAACQECTPETEDKPGCERCPPVALPLCTKGTFIHNSKDKNGCQTVRCLPCTEETQNEAGCEVVEQECPQISIPRCESGSFIKYSTNERNCSFASCEICSKETMNEPGCKTPSICPKTIDRKCPEGEKKFTVQDNNGCERIVCRKSETGCAHTNKPNCENGVAVRQWLGATCHWVCQQTLCPQEPPTCKPGYYRDAAVFKDETASKCTPWRCQLCDFEHRESDGCKPSPIGVCKDEMDWTIRCSAGEFRSVYQSPDTNCLTVRCTNCSELQEKEHDDHVHHVPAECREDNAKICPVPLIGCSRGSKLVMEKKDGNPCPVPVCVLCQQHESCHVSSTCSHKNVKSQSLSDCKENFFLENSEIDGCEAKICLPCRSEQFEKIAQCSQQVPDMCPPVQKVNCAAGVERIEQFIDDEGCPMLKCVKCEIPRSDKCPANQLLQSTLTHWGSCPTFTCRDKTLKVERPGEVTCPKTEINELQHGSANIGITKVSVGKCELNKFTFCPKPQITCSLHQLPMVTRNCHYECRDYKIESASTSKCFSGENIVTFAIDVSGHKSAFQIRFQIAAFVAKFASQVEHFGLNGTQVGIVLYSDRILQIISPDECNDVQALTRRLLHLRIETSASTSASMATLRHEDNTQSVTAEAVLACDQVMRKSVRFSSAKKSIVIITDALNSASNSMEDAITSSSNYERYFVAISSLYNRQLLIEAKQFASSSRNVLHLSSYQLLSTNGVSQLFPQCNTNCEKQQLRLNAFVSFLQELQSYVTKYESWLVQIQREVTVVQDLVSEVQYRYESKQVRLRLCSIMVNMYKQKLAELEQKLRTANVISESKIHVEVDEAARERVKQLELRLQMLSKKRAEIKLQLRDVKEVIIQWHEKLQTMRSEYSLKIKNEQLIISRQEIEITEKWQQLQKVMQQVTEKRIKANSQQTILKNKQDRVSKLVQLKTSLETRIRTLRIKISTLRNNTDSQQIERFENLEQQLSNCEDQAALEGFSPVTRWQKGNNLNVNEILTALQTGKTFSWMNDRSSEEFEQFEKLRNFTVGTYQEARLLLKDTSNRTLMRLTFRSDASDFNTFFTVRNLVDSFPWSLAAIKEALDVNWILFSSSLEQLAFTSVKGDSCEKRKFFFTTVTGRDSCEDVNGPYPRFYFSESLKMQQIQEMNEGTTLEILGKRLPMENNEWLTVLVASQNMPMQLQNLLVHRMLSQPSNTVPTTLSDRTFYKSQLMNNPAFSQFKIRLIDENNEIHEIAFNNVQSRETLVNSTWSRQALASATIFQSQSALQLLVGDSDPCTDSQGKGFVSISVGNNNKCPIMQSASGWKALISRSSSQPTSWNEAIEVKHLILLYRRHDFVNEENLINS